jgi:T5SS/PEP-CTERM-associated repeat protein
MGRGTRVKATLARHAFSAAVFVGIVCALSTLVGHAAITDTGDVACGASVCDIGASGTGSRVVDGASPPSSDVHDFIRLGVSTGAHGSLTVEHGASVTASSIFSLGFAGTGAIAVQSGGHVTTQFLEIGVKSTGSGTLTVDGPGSTMAIAGTPGALAIGREGTAQVTVSGGASMNASQTGLGEIGSGALSITGFGSHFTTTDLLIGRAGSGNVVISAGAQVTANGGTTLGEQVAGASGTLSITGGGSKLDTAAAISIGSAGKGSVTIDNGGAMTAGTSLFIGRPTGSQGELTVTDPTSHITVGGSLSLGVQGTGAVAITNGAVLKANAATFATLGGGVANAFVDGATSELDTGTLLRMGLNSSLNPLDPHGTATLGLANGGVAKATNMLIGPGGNAGGNGRLDGNVSLLGGALTPGAQGLLVSGNVTVNNDGKLVINVSGVGPAQHGVITISGDLVLISGGVRFNFTGGYVPKVNDTFTFLTVSGAVPAVDAEIPVAFSGVQGNFKGEVKIDPATKTYRFRALNDADAADVRYFTLVQTVIGSNLVERLGQPKLVCLNLPFCTVTRNEGSEAQHSQSAQGIFAAARAVISGTANSIEPLSVGTSASATVSGSSLEGGGGLGTAVATDRLHFFSLVDVDLLPPGFTMIITLNLKGHLQASGTGSADVTVTGIFETATGSESSKTASFFTSNCPPGSPGPPGLPGPPVPTCEGGVSGDITRAVRLLFFSLLGASSPLFTEGGVLTVALESHAAAGIDGDSGFSQFSDTLGVKSVDFFDSHGNLIPGLRVIGNSGIQYPVNVGYDFDGFYRPINNLPAVNTVKAGQAVPVKFSLGHNYGLDILTAGFPREQAVACDTAAPLGPPRQVLMPGDSTLSYDVTTNTYTLVWKTDKAWANTCRQLVLGLKDGSQHVAAFKLSK